ncbi:MAG: TonB-dependent receptor [Alphaproteobacteria bacterium]
MSGVCVRRAVCAAVLSAGIIPVPSGAQEAAGDDVIIVTAQKRAEDLQEVPLSIDVLSGEKLDVISSGGEDILFLAGRSPSLYAESSSGRTFPRFYIRGLGNTDFDLNASQPVSLIYDEIVLENPILKGFPVFDLERIEILRGPQGTLFGRNTPAGIVKFESARPTETFEGYARASYGRFNTVDAEGAVSGPLTGEALTGRLSALFQRRDDFVDNTFSGGEEGFEEFSEFAGRFQVQGEPSQTVTMLLNVHGRYLDGGSRLFRANVIRPGTGGLVPEFRRDETAQDATQILEVSNFGASLKTEAALDIGTLTSVTGYETVSIEARGDVDGGFGAVFAPPSGPGLIPFPAETADNITGHHQFTQEVRLLFEPVTRVTATAGAFFFHESLELENLSFDTLAGGVENGRAVQEQETLAWAVFTAAAWSAAPRWTLSAGLRLSGEEKDFAAERLVSPLGAGPLTPDPVQLDDIVLSGDASARYAVTEAVSLYTRYARSFRAPSVQGRILFGDAVTVADTETIDSIELGAKTEFWDGRGRFNVTGFYFRTDDQQLTAVGGAGNFNQLLNAGAVSGYGFEIDAQVTPLEGLDLTAGFSLNETEILDDDLEVGICGAPCTVLDPINPVTGNALIDGNPLPQAPRYIASVTARYGVPVFGGRGEAFIFTDWFYRSRINFFLYESVEFRDNGLVEGGMRVGYAHDGGRWEVAAFGRNILDDVSLEGAIDFNNFSGFVNEPPVWGVEAMVRY